MNYNTYWKIARWFFFIPALVLAALGVLTVGGTVVIIRHLEPFAGLKSILASIGIVGLILLSSQILTAAFLKLKKGLEDHTQLWKVLLVPGAPWKV